MEKTERKPLFNPEPSLRQLESRTNSNDPIPLMEGTVQTAQIASAQIPPVSFHELFGVRAYLKIDLGIFLHVVGEKVCL